MNRALLIAFLLTSVSQAQWSTDPANNLIVGYGLLPEIVSDSAGGCYITYEQNLNYPRRLILERLDRYGFKPWGTNRRILGELPEQSFAKVTEDGYGGIIVSYTDLFTDGQTYIIRQRVQRVDSSGNFLWGATGVRVSLADPDQINQAVVSDGNGGCIVAWVETDTISSQYRLRINRIDAEGARVWGESGKFVWNYGFQAPWRPTIVADGRGGCVLLFGAARAQRFGPSGIPLWDSSGVQLENLGNSKLASDGSGGVVLAGMKFISYNNGDPLWAAKTQRVDSLGQVLWGNNGLTLEDSLYGLFFNPPGIMLTNNTGGGATIAWGTRTSPSVLDLKTQIVRGNGNTILDYRGIRVSRVASNKGILGIVPSDSMSTLYVWFDNRTPLGVYAQRLDTLGTTKWDTNDIALCVVSIGGLKITSDTRGGCILTGWRESDFTVRAQQISKNGNLGEVITSVGEKNGYNIPERPILHQNYPNPFNPVTKIKFSIPISDKVQIRVYDILGGEIQAIVNEYMQAGTYEVEFDAGNLSSGMYFYRIISGSYAETKPMILLR